MRHRKKNEVLFDLLIAMRGLPVFALFSSLDDPIICFRCFTSYYEEFMRDRTRDLRLTPAILLQPHCHVIKFPTGLELCFKICKLCSVLQCTENPEVENAHLFQTLSKLIGMLDSQATVNLFAVCLPFVQTLTENETTRSLAIYQIMPVACKPLSRRRNQETFLRLVIKCYDEERVSPHLEKVT